MLRVESRALPVADQSPAISEFPSRRLPTGCDPSHAGPVSFLNLHFIIPQYHHHLIVIIIMMVVVVVTRPVVPSVRGSWQNGSELESNLDDLMDLLDAVSTGRFPRFGNVQRRVFVTQRWRNIPVRRTGGGRGGGGGC